MTVAYMNKPNDSITNLNLYSIQSNHPIIEIHISCQNLVKLDIGSESDPMCVFMTSENGKFTEIERTEVIYNNPNPNFVKSFKTYYIFEANQPLRFEVYDCDSSKISLEKHDFIGFCETDVQYLVSNLDQQLTFELLNDEKKGKRGEIILICHQTKESSICFKGQIQAQKLKKMKTFARNNPFFEISKPSESGRLIPVYRSEVQRKCFGCTFKDFTISYHALCTSGLDDPITISFYDNQRNKAPKLIGKYESSIRHFMESLKTNFDLIDSKSKNVGQFLFHKFEVTQEPTFADYLRSGLQLNMITAIDFTSSNGDPRSSSSLHYISNDSNQLNQYQQTILSVGSVLTKYDKDQKFPVYGFGAKFDDQVSKCFPLTFDSLNPEVNGLQGILNIYKKAIEKVELWGPTCFSPVINEATKIALESYKQNKIYTILLILTDGVIDDMSKTIDSIVEASDAPLSIIIVGVGKADFSDMDKLDADEHPLKSSSKVVMKRDIVQFVPFNQFKNGSSMRLEAEVLAEVPLQVHQFCSTHGFIPLLPQNDLLS